MRPACSATRGSAWSCRQTRFGACLFDAWVPCPSGVAAEFNNLDPVFVEDRQSTAPELRLLLPSAVRDHGVSTSPIARRALEELITDIAGEFRTSAGDADSPATAWSNSSLNNSVRHDGAYLSRRCTCVN